MKARLAIADRLKLASAVPRNVIFLVMDDEAPTLPVPGGYQIDTIVGLPVPSKTKGRTLADRRGARVRLSDAATALDPHLP